MSKTPLQKMITFSQIIVCTIHVPKNLHIRTPAPARNIRKNTHKHELTRLQIWCVCVRACVCVCLSLCLWMCLYMCLGVAPTWVFFAVCWCSFFLPLCFPGKKKMHFFPEKILIPPPGAGGELSCLKDKTRALYIYIYIHKDIIVQNWVRVLYPCCVATRTWFKYS